MNETTWTCDRCGEMNDISDISGVSIVEHCDGTGEVVCKPCIQNEYKTEMELALFGSLD